MTITIKTNNVPRSILSFNDLSDYDKQEVLSFGMQDTDQWKGFMFKDELYDLNDFAILSEGSEEKALGWDGAAAQSASHAVLVKLDHKNFDSVVVGQVFC